MRHKFSCILVATITKSIKYTQASYALILDLSVRLIAHNDDTLSSTNCVANFVGNIEVQQRDVGDEEVSLINAAQNFC